MIRIMDSHAYPGCRALADIPATDGPVSVEFSDGVVTGAHVRHLDKGEIALTIDAYRTSRGSAIARKSWLLEHRGEDRWHIRRKLEGNDHDAIRI